MLGKETAETNLRTLRLPCYLQLLGVDVGERDCGDESADGAVTMLLYTNLRTLLLPCYLQLLGVDVGERDCGDESADASVTMLFAAEGRCCCYHAICSCWG